MSRWDPGTEERLKKAALELCGEHGYDSVTVSQIAERAGITRRSYFRYFPDKREVLFAGSEQLPVAVAAAVLDAEKGLSPCRRRSTPSPGSAPSSPGSSTTPRNAAP